MDDVLELLDPGDLRDAIAEDRSLSLFARDWGVSTYQIIRFARQHGIDLPERKRPPARTLDDVVAAHAPDVSAPPLPATTEKPAPRPATPRPAAESRRRRNRWDDRDRLAQAVREGRSDEDIAADADVAPSTVATWRSQHGVKRSRPRQPRPAPPPRRRNSWDDADRLATAVADGMTDADIAAEADVAASTVATWRRKHGVRRRRPAAPARPKASGPRRRRAASDPRLQDGAWLGSQYGPPGFRTTPDIAAELGVAGNTVRHWMQRHGIEMRPRKTKYAQLFYREWVEPRVQDDDTRTSAAIRIADELGCTPSAAEDALRRHGLAEPEEHRAPHPTLEDADEMRRLWVDERMSDEAIADHLGVGATTAGRYRRRHGLTPDDRANPLADPPFVSSFPELNDPDVLGEMYASASASEVGEQVGCSAPTVLLALRAHGIPVRLPGVRVESRDAA